MPKNQTKISLVVPTDLWEKVKALSEKEHRSINGQAIWMLERMLEHLEKEAQ